MRGPIVRIGRFTNVAVVVLSTCVLTISQTATNRAQAQSYTPRSVVAQCQRCLDHMKETNSKVMQGVAKDSLIGILGCLTTGPGAPFCFAVAEVATLGNVLIEGASDPGCDTEGKYGCAQLHAALEKKIFSTCEVSVAGSKAVRTLIVCRNGFGTAVAASCAAAHPGTPSTSSACTNLHCPTTNTAC